MKRLCLWMLIVTGLLAGSARAVTRGPVSAVAIQNEGTTNVDVLAGVGAVNGVWSPVDVVPNGTVIRNYYAAGTSVWYFDAVNLEFDSAGLSLAQLTLRLYAQKGSYHRNEWEHYMVLPGLSNTTYEDDGPTPEVSPGMIDHQPGGELSANATVGWIEIPFDATSDPAFISGDGNVSVTLRLWNWRLDAVALSSPPAPGDFDEDGDVDADDIDLLCDNLGDADFDLDGDGDADEDDLVYLVENLVELQDGSGRVGTAMGDFNLDGLVNGTDAAIMKSAFGTWPRGWADGNANCDDVINSTDLAILKANFGAAPTGPAAFPEPATMGLLTVGAFGLLRRRRR